MDPGKWLSSESRGIGPWLVRSALWWGQWPYSAAVGWRNRRFDRGVGVGRVEVPVISIGNLTTGGTGKTPTVAWLCRWLREAGVRVTTISRGYGAQDSSGRNDEAIELEQLLPDVPHLQNPDRLAAAAIAIDELAAQCLVLDDAFQHRRIARDLDWVVVDARNPFGFGYLLPRGLLREPVRSLRRADAILISRADQVSAGELNELRATLKKWARPQVPVVACAHAPVELVNADGETRSLVSESADGSAYRPSGPITAFCGIGNPEAFRDTLKSLGLEPDAWRVFPDHHRYSRDDLASLGQGHRQTLETSPWQSLDQSEKGSGSFLCTVKDLVKIETVRIDKVPLWAVRVGLRFLDDPSPLLFQLGPIVDRAKEQQGFWPLEMDGRGGEAEGFDDASLSEGT